MTGVQPCALPISAGSVSGRSQVNDDQQAPVREGAYEMTVKVWPPAGRLLFGAAFYHEYQPAYLGRGNEERLRVDFDLMRRPRPIFFRSYHDAMAAYRS